MVSRIPPPEDDGTNRQPRSAGLLALLLVFALVVGIWLVSGRDPGSGTSTATDDTSAAAPGAPGGQGDPATTPTTSDAAELSSSASAQPEQTPSAQPPVGGSEAPSSPPSIDPDSGLPTVYLLDLPPEAAVTVEAIDDGPPYAYEEDGSTFGNYEGLLPDHERGYYEEFTVETPGSYDRGAKRIIEGADGELYWTDDHYESFSRVLL